MMKPSQTPEGMMPVWPEQNLEASLLCLPASATGCGWHVLFCVFFFPPQWTLSSTTPDLQLSLFAVLSLLSCGNRGVKVLPQIEVSYSQCLITVGFNPSSCCFSIIYLSMVPFRSLIIANISDASYWLFVNIYNIKPWNVQMFLHYI